jgi:HD superfamily phosphodiesterase
MNGQGTTGRVARAMIAHYAGDPKRISHFLKVHGLAKTIGELEGLDERTQHVLEVAALTHDIGIKVSEERYGNCAGHHQEIEGPPIARKMLEQLDLDSRVIDRVCWLIAHHHTYDAIVSIDHQVLVEADLLVNIVEDGLSEPAVDSIREKVFRTRTGIELLEDYRPMAR